MKRIIAVVVIVIVIIVVVEVEVVAVVVFGLIVYRKQNTVLTGCDFFVF